MIDEDPDWPRERRCERCEHWQRSRNASGRCLLTGEERDEGDYCARFEEGA